MKSNFWICAIFASSFLLAGCGPKFYVAKKLVGTWECSKNENNISSLYSQTYFRDGTYKLNGSYKMQDSANGESFDIVYGISSAGSWSVEFDGTLKQTETKKSIQNKTEIPGLDYRQNNEARKMMDNELLPGDANDAGGSSFFTLDFKSADKLESTIEGGGNHETCKRK